MVQGKYFDLGEYLGNGIDTQWFYGESWTKRFG